jgi:hypothetical protein
LRAPAFVGWHRLRRTGTVAQIICVMTDACD